MKSLITVIEEVDFSKINEDQYFELLKKLDPELYLVRIALDETKINPLILPKIIRSIGNLNIGTGDGKIQIFMEKRIVTVIKGEETVRVGEQASVRI